MSETPGWEMLESIVRGSHYLTLATADGAGLPWAAPVWFATADCREFFWASSPTARHSVNLAARPELAMAVFDSTQPPGTGVGAYLSAVGEQVGEEALDDGLAVFATGLRRAGLPAWTRALVTPPAKHRLYHARCHAHFVLSDRDERIQVFPPGHEPAG